MAGEGGDGFAWPQGGAVGFVFSPFRGWDQQRRPQVIVQSVKIRSRRVEPAVARWLPHRPGRAGLPHPVLPVEGLLRSF
jgi:hypothetical protein